MFCGPQSELTHQAKNLGYRAERFGFQQGDLSTVEGREKLFQVIVQRQPQNLWFSPTCGPWSAWNNLNAAKSVSSFDSIHSSAATALVSDRSWCCFVQISILTEEAFPLGTAT